MIFNDRLRTGLMLASNSFRLLWIYKILLTYLVINTIIIILTNIFTASYGNILFSLQALGLKLPALEMAQWLIYVRLISTKFILILISIFVNVSLIYHVRYIIHERQSIPIVKCFRWALSKSMIITLWAIVSTIIIVGLEQAPFILKNGTFLTKLALIIVTLLSWSWALISLLVLPIIAVERTTIIQALIKSITIVRTLIVEIIFGELWIALITILGLFPFVILQMLFSTSLLPRFIILIVAPLIILGIVLIHGTILTIHTIFKIKLYHYYKRPIEEMQELRYPRF